MKIDIIVVYMKRYIKGHEYNFVPPVTGIHLAALTPSHHEVRQIHQQVQEIDYNSDADIIAVSFFTGFAPEAYSIANNYKKKNVACAFAGIFCRIVFPLVRFCSFAIQ